MNARLDVLMENPAFVALHQPEHRLVSVFFVGPPDKKQVAIFSEVLAAADERSDAMMIYVESSVTTPPRPVREELSRAVSALRASAPGIVCVVPGTGIGASVKRTMSSVIFSLSGVRAAARVVGDAALAGEWLAERLDDESLDTKTMTGAVEQAVLAALGT